MISLWLLKNSVLCSAILQQGVCNMVVWPVASKPEEGAIAMIHLAGCPIYTVFTHLSIYVYIYIYTHTHKVYTYDVFARSTPLKRKNVYGDIYCICVCVCLWMDGYIYIYLRVRVRWSVITWMQIPTAYYARLARNSNIKYLRTYSIKQDFRQV